MSRPVLVALLAVIVASAASSTSATKLEQQSPISSPDPLSQAAEVGDTSSSGALETLQTRIAGAQPGEFIDVPAGIYRGLLEITTPKITVQAAGDAVFDGQGAGTPITVLADDVVIRGLRIRNSSQGPLGQPAGIQVEGADVRIEDNIIDDTYIGIALVGAEDTIVDGNHITGLRGAVIAEEGHALEGSLGGGDHRGAQGTTRGDGISMWDTERALITDNVITGVRDGIYLSYGEDIRVERNVVTESRYATHDMYSLNPSYRANRFQGNLAGAVLMYGGPVTLERNLFLDNRSPSTGFGILVKDAGGVHATGNTIAGNRVGVQFDNGGSTIVDATWMRGNTIAMNLFGVVLAPSAQASFSENNVIENTIPVLLIGGDQTPDVHWAESGRGNYWSGYRGFDSDGDGVGDLPHLDPGTVEEMVAHDPTLTALASAPGLQLLGSLESRWIPDEPAVEDPSPLMHPLEPAVRGPRPVSEPPLAFALVAFASVAVCTWLLLRARRPRGRRRREGAHA